VIPIVIAIVGAAAVGAGTAAGRWIYRRVRKSPDDERAPMPAASDESAKSTASAPRSDDPLAVGDVLMLDGGRAGELWLVRRLALSESDGDPFLVLFEAYPRAGASRALLGWDPLAPDRVDVLSPSPLEEAGVLTRARTSRPPSTLDVPLDDRHETVQLTMRRVAKGDVSTAPDADGPSDLPTPGGEMLVARYAGSSDACALVVRDDAGHLFTYAGRRIAFDESSVLRNRETP
jgi:hypothetical protein